MERESTALETRDVLIGTKVGNCRIVKRIGSGGMGVVYRAEHEGLGKAVAIKVLARQAMGSEEAVARFLREARTAAKLDHPNVVQVHDVGSASDFHYIVMQFVEGRSLDVILREKQTLPVKQALAVVRHVASALSAAHALGIVHRDIKPANILVSKDGKVKVADFGLARDSETGRTVSTTGQILGTPAYMAPEQAEGRATDARTDLYSLGCTLYHLVTGVRPFEGSAPLATVLKQIKEDPTPAESLVPLPPEVARLIRRLMAKDPAARPASAGELLREMDGPGEVRRSRLPWMAGLAGAVVIAAGLAWGLSRPGPAPVPPSPAPQAKAPEPPPPPKRSEKVTALGVRIVGMTEAIAKVDETHRPDATELAKAVEAFYDALASKDMERAKEFFDGPELVRDFAERPVAKLAKDKAYTVTELDVDAFYFEERGPRRMAGIEGTLKLTSGTGSTMTQPTRTLAWAKRGERWMVVPARR